MEYVFYVSVKLICYIGWSWVALRLWRGSTSIPWSWVGLRLLRESAIRKAIGFGILRLAIGVAFGITIFIIVPVQRDEVFWKYLAIYTPVRMVEWLILAGIIGRSSERQTTRSVVLWCLGGIVVSFAADFASPEGVAGHFCVGRCLC